jgi:hypothetical protein
MLYSRRIAKGGCVNPTTDDGGAEGTHCVYEVGLAHLTGVRIEQDLSLLVGNIRSLTLSVCATIAALKVEGPAGSAVITVGGIRTPRSICTGLDEHPPFHILGDALVGQIALVHVECVSYTKPLGRLTEFDLAHSHPQDTRKNGDRPNN